MKKLIAIILVLFTITPLLRAHGAHYVKGYYTRNGTYVPGHYETNANGNFYDNWSTRGNYNPWTGKQGWISQPQHHPAYYDRFGVYHPAN
jgi:hypothetical protein